MTTTLLPLPEFVERARSRPALRSARIRVPAAVAPAPAPAPLSASAVALAVAVAIAVARARALRVAWPRVFRTNFQAAPPCRDELTWDDDTFSVSRAKADALVTLRHGCADVHDMCNSGVLKC